MRNLLIMLFVLLNSSTWLFGQLPSDNFDWPTGNWLSTGGGNPVNFFEITTSNYSINNNSLQVVHYDQNNPWVPYVAGYTYGNSEESSIKYRYFQTTNFYNIILSFSWLCNGEADRDFGTLYFSSDGLNWDKIKNYQSGKGNEIQFEVIKLPKCYDNSGFYIGFSFTSDNSFNFQPGFVIDDINLSGNDCVINPKPPAASNPQNLVECYNNRDAVSLTAFSVTGNLRWYMDAFGCADHIHEGLTFNTLPTENKVFYVSNFNGNTGCESDLRIPVTLTTLPLPALSIDTVLDASQGGDGAISISVSGSSPFAYTWTMNEDPAYAESTQDINGLNEGNYQVFVTDAMGCKDSLRIVVLSKAELNIPGGISPNGDGYNDTWIISGIAQWTDYVVELRNMRGELVYKQDATDNPTYVPFDGKNQKGEKLPSGDYSYFLRSQFRKKKYSGILSIKYDN